MGADKSFLNAEGMWYGSSDDDPVSKAHLRERAATVMPAMKRPLPAQVGSAAKAGKAEPN